MSSALVGYGIQTGWHLGVFPAVQLCLLWFVDLRGREAVPGLGHSVVEDLGSSG